MGASRRTSGRLSAARATPAPVAATPSFSDPPSSAVPSGPGPSAYRTPAPRSAGANGSLEADPVQTVPSTGFRVTPRRSSRGVPRGANWLPVEDLAAVLARNAANEREQQQDQATLYRSAIRAYREYMTLFKGQGLWTPKTRGEGPEDHDASIRMRCDGKDVGEHAIYQRGQQVAGKCKEVLLFYEKNMRVSSPGGISYDPPSGVTEDAQWEQVTHAAREELRSKFLNSVYVFAFLSPSSPLMRDGGAAWQSKQGLANATFRKFFDDRKMNEFHVDPNFRHQSNGLSREQVRTARNFAQRQGRNANTLEHPAGHAPPQDAVESALLDHLSVMQMQMQMQMQVCKAIALKAGVPEESLVVVPPASAGTAGPSVPCPSVPGGGPGPSASGGAGGGHSAPGGSPGPSASSPSRKILDFGKVFGCAEECLRRSIVYKRGEDENMRLLANISDDDLAEVMKAEIGTDPRDAPLRAPMDSGGERTISFQKLVKHVRSFVTLSMRFEYDCMNDDGGGDDDDDDGGHHDDDGGDFEERVPFEEPVPIWPERLRARRNSMSIEISPPPAQRARLERVPENEEILDQQGHATPRRHVVPETEPTEAPPSTAPGSRSSGRRARPPNRFRDEC